MVSVEPSTGAVRAVVGGPGFDTYKYDIATYDGPDGNGGRQTGSSFKTFVLLTALEQGIQPNDYVAGTGTWPNKGGTPDPVTITGVGGTLDSVTSASSNGAYVRLGQVVGRQNVIDMAHRLGVTSTFDPRVIVMPLGVFNITPLEMASAYSAIPNGGVRNPQYFIDRVEDRDGNVLISHSPAPTRAFSSQTACLATDILKHNVEGGTAKNAQLNGQDAAGKTGTTDKNTDTWFVGFTPYLTTAVWMGFPDGAISMPRIYGQEQFGGLYPAKAWKAFNQAYLDREDKPAAPFPGCAPLPRGGRPAAGADDPYGTLNGGSAPGQAPVSSGHGGGGAAPPAGGGAGDVPPAGPDTTPTTAAPTTPTTAAPTTTTPRPGPGG
jgi:penicillin-binding protein 1A